jgi:hypothetical protein
VDDVLDTTPESNHISAEDHLESAHGLGRGFPACHSFYIFYV